MEHPVDEDLRRIDDERRQGRPVHTTLDRCDLLPKPTLEGLVVHRPTRAPALQLRPRLGDDRLQRRHHPLERTGISSIIVATGHPPRSLFGDLTLQALPRAPTRRLQNDDRLRLTGAARRSLPTLSRCRRASQKQRHIVFMRGRRSKGSPPIIGREILEALGRAAYSSTSRAAGSSTKQR